MVMACVFARIMRWRPVPWTRTDTDGMTFDRVDIEPEQSRHESHEERDPPSGVAGHVMPVKSSTSVETENVRHPSD